MSAPYSLDEAIASFCKSNTTANRQQCDDFALAHGTQPVTPVQIQGTFSYTVLAGTDKLFQFRVPSSGIDINLLNTAATIHPGSVSRCTFHGAVGGEQPLLVYEMDNLPGLPDIFARDISIPQPQDSILRQQSTVEGLAKFFAQAWSNPQPLNNGAEPAAVASEFEAKFDRLNESLPPRFAPTLNRLRRALPSLFSGAGIPLVLTHGDLCEMNVLFDPEGGSLTGVIDWAEARILPFGFARYAPENFLGYMDSKGWHYYDNAQELRDLFWRVFREEIGGAMCRDKVEMIWAARMAGLFYRDGFVFDGKEVDDVVGPESSSVGYLDAFCMVERWVPVENI